MSDAAVGVLGFTGHRNRLAPRSNFLSLHREFPDAEWLHGGAAGFDSQVDGWARYYDRRQRILRPDYHAHPGAVAPLIRNREIVDACDLLVACWDGRETGGTAYTIRYAEEAGKPLRIWRPAAAEVCR